MSNVSSRAKPLKGVRYVVDGKGEKQAVLIDLKIHGKLWEDFRDMIVSQQRQSEPTESLEEVEAKLRASGRLK